jgi:hypothetical protein
MDIETIPIGNLQSYKIAEYLRERGWIVTPNSRFSWETPSAFSLRHGHHKNWFSACRCRGQVIPEYESDNVKSKKLVLMRSNEALEEWCQHHPTNKKPQPQRKAAIAARLAREKR